MLSLVIPVYNEEESLAPLHAEILDVAQREGLDVEIILIDDGSRDGSWTVITELAKRHPNVHGLRFRRNFGKAAALSAGFRAARGDIILTLDADLQDDPAEVPRFLATLAQGQETSGPKRVGPLDVVSGWKRTR